MTAAHPTAPTDRPRPGLRERKKIKTREAIRSAAYALIERQGYDATTIEQIAALAEVSPSTVSRYFAGKEDIVLPHEHAGRLLDALRARPADEPWQTSLRHVLRTAVDLGTAEGLEVTRLRGRLLAEVPAVRARLLETVSATGHLLSEAVAERAGQGQDRLEVRVFTMSLLGGLMEVPLYWAEHGFRDDLTDLVDRALDGCAHPPPAPNS
ncbi:TetR/AcrR family transcriptional regulator [Streptomyces griseoviridis]